VKLPQIQVKVTEKEQGKARWNASVLRVNTHGLIQSGFLSHSCVTFFISPTDFCHPNNMRFLVLGQNSRPVLMYITTVSYCRFSVPGTIGSKNRLYYNSTTIPVSARPKACFCGRSLVEDCEFESCRGHECLSVVSVCDGPITRPEESYRVWCVWVNVNIIIIVHLWLMKIMQSSNASLISTFSKVIVILMLKLEDNLFPVA